MVSRAWSFVVCMHRHALTMRPLFLNIFYFFGLLTGFLNGLGHIDRLCNDTLDSILFFIIDMYIECLGNVKNIYNKVSNEFV